MEYDRGAIVSKEINILLTNDMQIIRIFLSRPITHFLNKLLGKNQLKNLYALTFKV